MTFCLLIRNGDFQESFRLNAGTQDDVFTPIWMILIKDLNLYNDDKTQSDQRRQAQSGSTHCEASNLPENVTEEEQNVVFFN